MKCYERKEFEFKDGADYIEIIRPDGKTDIVKAFKKPEPEFEYDEEGHEHITLSEKTTDCCRYTPDFCGNMRINVFKDDALKETHEIIVDKPDEHGYISVSEKDSRYFKYSDGTPFFAVGINLAFPTVYVKSNGYEFGLSDEECYLGIRQYERWFKKCAENGVNLVRIWLGHDYFSPDTEQTGIFRNEQFAKIDAIFSLAHKYNIKLKLTLEQFRYFSYEHNNNYISSLFGKQLYNNNKRCENIHEWLSVECWGQAWLLKIEEFAKRYSGDTAIFAVELWNEMNCICDVAEINTWCRIYADAVRKLFDRHMIINSLGSLDSDSLLCYNQFDWDLYDFDQMHRYLDQGADLKECHINPIELIRYGFDERKRENRPLLLAETGAVNNCHSGPFRYYSTDDRGIIFADSVYTPLFLGSCGTGNIWHWDNRYVESKNLYHMFKPLSKLIENVNFINESFIQKDLSDNEVYCFILEGKTMTLGYIRNKNDNWKNVLRDDKAVSPIKEKAFEIKNASEAYVFPIWNEDTTELSLENGNVIIKNILYGTLFKIKN